MSTADARRMALEMPGFPTLPQVVAHIVEASASETSSATELGALIEADHAVTTRVLRLANSAFYRRSRRVASVRQAVVLLGFNTIRLLALSVSAFEAVATVEQSSIEMEDLWMHSFGAAECAREIESLLGHDAPEGLLFTAALLHDVGKSLLAASQNEAYARTMELATVSGRKLAALEVEQLGLHHGQIAAWLCDRWRFPEQLVETLRFLPEHTTYRGRWRRDVGIVALAEHMSRLAGFGNCGDPPESALDANLASAVGINEANANQILGRVVKSRDEMRQVLLEWKA